MVVADADSPGPVRKKARLSLKKGSNDSTTNTPTSVPVKEEPRVAKEVSENLTDKEIHVSADGDTSLNDSSVVPAVASLENLGNTCFLNSVLQVLRFTPGFLDRLDDLYQELVQIEKSKKKELNEETDDEIEQFIPPQTCELVKFLYKLYRSMERREEKHHEIATADVMSMAIKPERILNAIRELNPMFEGCLQHDAQELLRCILCYLQDAEKEVLKLKDSLPPAILFEPVKQINPIMQSFLMAGKGDRSQALKGDKSPVLCTEKRNEILFKNTASSDIVFNKSHDVNLSKSDILEHIDASETALTGGSVEVVSPVKTPECQIADEPVSNIDEKENSKKSNCINVKRSRKKKNARLELENFGAENCNGVTKRMKCEVVTNLKSESQKLSQPSVMTMLKGSVTCKRLGMRGAVLKPKDSSNCTNDSSLSSSQMTESGFCDTDTCISQGNECNQNCVVSNRGDMLDEVDSSADIIETDLKSKSVKEANSPSRNTCDQKQTGASRKISLQQRICAQSSPSKGGSHSAKNSPLKSGMPVVKLENCDHICDSPKKSVSAAYATKTLSPMNSKNMSAITKLDFLDSNKVVQIKDEKVVKKKDFVEKLFMGSLMLRTTCMECEFSREKIEEFHDISVAVRKEKTDESDDEDDEENDEDGEEGDNKGTSLPKLMESFSEIERLKGDNKYYCDKCQHLVEAERSLHYNVLPDVLSVHLKRFSTASGIFGYVSKINDHVRIPLSLPCLRHKCPRPCSRSDHRYRLYSLIAHAGVTLTSGHYLTYVRVNNSSMHESQQSGSRAYNSLSSPKSPALVKNCLSAFNSQSQRALPGSPLTPQSGRLSKYVKVPSQKYEDCWLECDDESVKVYSEENFCSMLKGDESSLLGTPYVLFYHRYNMT